MSEQAILRRHGPSELHLEVDADGGIHVGGTIHELGAGVLVL